MLLVRLEKFELTVGAYQPLEDDGFHVPTISEKLMARIKDLATGYTGVLPAGNVSQVLYHLQAFQSHPPMQVCRFPHPRG